MLKIRRLCKERCIARKVYFIAKKQNHHQQNPKPKANQTKPNQTKKTTKTTQPATDNCKFMTLYKHFCRNFTEQNSHTKLKSWVSVRTVCKHLLTGMETVEYNSMFKEILTELQAIERAVFP